MHERHPAEVPVISRLFGVPDSHKLDVYLQYDGYKGLERALKELTPEQVIDEVKKSNLRGRGGAGFPTGMKWSFVPKESAKPKYILCNADESEPGTCKDRPLMEMAPHQLIEGVIIAGRAVGAHRGYIYIRGEYRYVLDIVDAAIEEAYARGYLGKNILGSGFDFDLHTHTGAGAYECGEESALMESLEGKRGYPRIRPPFPAVVGLYGSPTVINNVETLSSVPAILHRGGEWYAGLGSAKNGGTRLFCISGHVNRPGIYELPMGFNLKRMIEDVAGGIAGRQKAESGDSRRQFLPASEGRRDRSAHGFRFAGQGRIDAGLGRRGGDRRKHLHGGPGAAHHAFLRARILRLVHSLPRRHGWLRKMLDRFHAGGGRARRYSADRRTGEKHARAKRFARWATPRPCPRSASSRSGAHEFEEHLAGKCPYQPAEALAAAR